MVSGGGAVIKVGFVINFRDRNWIGGIHYYKNLLNAIYALPGRTIEPVVFTGYTSDKEVLEGFPGIRIIRSHMFDSHHPLFIFRHSLRVLVQRDVILERLLEKHDIALLSHYRPIGKRALIPAIGWIADFQHKHLPGFFSKKEIGMRDRLFRQICSDCACIVFSSWTAKKDADQFFPEYTAKFRVLQFVAWNINLRNLPDFNELKTVYGIKTPFFFVPNQFWAHKNHGILLEALRILKDRGSPVHLVFTGNPLDRRNPDYYHNLLEKIDKSGISHLITILGMIPYDHLIQLMRHSQAVINPSYFEGWSTTVEEAKILDRTILLSDIPVHREQNPRQGYFFNPDNPQQLADLLISLNNATEIDPGISTGIYDSLELRKKEFARNYEKIVLETIDNFRR